MFIPNVQCEISRMTGTTVHGKRQYAPWQKVKCGVVRLVQETGKTSVRTDSSASRGSATEENTNSRILFPKSVTLKAGDRVRFHGFEMTVISVFPRHNVAGAFDHWQVDLDVWKG